MSEQAQETSEQDEKQQEKRQRERWLALLLLLLLVACCVFTSTSLAPLLMLQRADAQLSAAQLDYSPWAFGTAIPFDYSGLATAISSGGGIFGPGLFPGAASATPSPTPTPTLIPSETPGSGPSATPGSGTGGGSLPTSIPSASPAAPTPTLGASSTPDPGLPTLTPVPPTNTPIPASVLTDLAITLTDGRTLVAANNTVIFTIVVTNNGPSAASAASVTSTFDADFDVLAWTCTPAGGAICGAAGGAGNLATTADLPPGSSVTYTVTAHVAAAAPLGALSSTATVTVPPGMIDTVPANNSATDANTIVVNGLVVTTITDGVDTTAAGDGVCVSAGSLQNCSLRAAIQEANGTAGIAPLLIRFDIPGASPYNLNPVGVLPDITRAAVQIDGSTQPGYSGTPLIVLTGPGAAGLRFNTVAGGQVRALDITGYTRGIDLNAATDIVISNNYLNGNNQAGLYIGAASDRAIAQNNVMGGTSGGYGVVVNASNDATIQNNLIGLNATGTALNSNAQGGVLISGGSGALVQNNSISGLGMGITVDTGATNWSINNNRIGTDVTGTVNLGNSARGIYINAAGTGTGITNNVVVGSGAGSAILIDTYAGALLPINGNFIGVSSGGAAMPNALNGIRIDDSALLQITNNQIANNQNGIYTEGTTTTLDVRLNNIFNNTQNGVSLTGTSSQNLIVENSIYDNGALPINLDPGNNNDQVAPVLTSAILILPGQVQISGSLTTGVDATYRLDFYLNPVGSADPEGRTWLFTANVVTVGGTVNFVLNHASGLLTSGQIIRATATDAVNNTSEFSNAVTIP